MQNNNNLLSKIVECGLSAPSAHNTQPWLFEIHGGANKIILTPDYSKSLPVGDQDMRLFYISLGCCVENIVYGANAYGAESEVEYFFNGEDNLDRIEFKINITDGEAASDRSDHLSAINQRVTNRFGYTFTEEDIDLVKSLLETISNDGVHQFLVTREVMGGKFIQIMLAAYDHFMKSNKFREELSHYVRNNLTKQKDGMPAYGMGIPTPVSFLAPFLIRNVNLATMENKHNKQIFENETPLWLVLGVDIESRQNWMNLGRQYEHIALELTKKGISTHVWASPTQSKKYRQELADLLECQFIPTLTLRIGRATKDVKKPPKKDLQDVLKLEAEKQA